MPSISKRGQAVPLSPFRKLVPVADRAREQGVQIYHLNIGQPDIETPAYALQKLKETDLKILAYSPANGIRSYRQALAAYYRKFELELNPDHIVVSTGASEAIQFVLLSCFDHGEEVIIPEPFYANYNGFAQIADVHIRPITCHIEDGFALPSVETFEQHITPRTRAIAITNPNNPTGSFYPREVLEALAALVKKHNLFLIVDEVYGEFCYDQQAFFSVLKLEEIAEHVIVIDSISKRFSACGARIGAVITRNESVLEAVTRYAKLRLSPPGLGQILAEAILGREEEAYLAQVKAEYDRRRMVVFNRLQKMRGVISYKPGGAFYCFARFPVDSAERFCRWMLEEFRYQNSTVMLSPGEGFYATPGLGKDEVRIAYVLHSQDLSSAMDCLEKGLEAYPGRLDQHIDHLFGISAH